MVIALASRRLYALDAAQKRFQGVNAQVVKHRIRDFLQSHDESIVKILSKIRASVKGEGHRYPTNRRPALSVLSSRIILVPPVLAIIHPERLSATASPSSTLDVPLA